MAFHRYFPVRQRQLLDTRPTAKNEMQSMINCPSRTPFPLFYSSQRSFPANRHSIFFFLSSCLCRCVPLAQNLKFHRFLALPLSAPRQANATLCWYKNSISSHCSIVLVAFKILLFPSSIASSPTDTSGSQVKFIFGPIFTEIVSFMPSISAETFHRHTSTYTYTHT